MIIRLPRNAQIWLPGYFRRRLASLRLPPPRRLWVIFADHFEPLWRGAGPTLARERVQDWRERWPRIAARIRDSVGNPPRWTFFYPEEEYWPELLEPLAELTRAGIADVEVHIHHDGEGEQHFLDRMRRFLEALAGRHGLLRRQNGRLLFGFIHGNWALDNSLPGGRYCGLNNEISLLRDLGCYADFTMPSAPWPSQARMVNAIYWAVDDPQRPKSYDRGIPAAPGGGRRGDLLMIPGPLGLFWEAGPPHIENGELGAHKPMTPTRARAWLRLAPQLGEDAFLKLFTHGAQEAHRATLLGEELDRVFGLLAAECKRRACQLRFATAWEAYQVIEGIIGRDVVASPAGNVL
ncbi:MAG: hypothetical protein ACP5U2_09440 [Bryobacteraceae bacterium]